MKYCKVLICSLLPVFVASIASATLSNVIPIPWEGDVTKFHTTVAGTNAALKGLIKATDSGTSIQYQWNFGDGTPFTVPVTLNGHLRYRVSATHIYAGDVGTPFVAWLIATDGTTTSSNQYLVRIQAPGLTANINMAIDNGLWFLYQQGNYVPDGSGSTSFNTVDKTACVWWASVGSFQGSGYYSSPTASAVQAFEINGSLASGDFTQDPYAEYTAAGLNFLMKGFTYNPSYPVLQAVTIMPRSVDPQDNPDSNGNGVGIQTFDDGGVRDPYQGGMVMDAIVASGTPGASSGRQFISGHTATFQDVVQDMCDMYGWGQDIANLNYTWVNTPSTLTSLPASVPDSITFNTFDLTCSPSAVAYTFYVNGQAVGSIPLAAVCNCAGGGNSLVVSGAQLSAAWALASPPNLAVNYSGATSYGSSWVHASLDFGGDLLTLCLTNFNAGGCDYTANACSGFSTAAYTASNLVSGFPVLADQNIHRLSQIVGGWNDSWQYPNAGKNSVSQWAAIGLYAAEQPPFNCVVPGWLKTNDNNFLNYTYSTDNGGLWGHFGYELPGQFTEADGYFGASTTPAGMVQMILDGFTTSDPRWIAAEAWLAQNWDTGENWLANVMNTSIDSAYAVTKAMRLALPSPVATFDTNGFNWYLGNSTDSNGLAKTISDNLLAHGFWDVNHGEDFLVGQNLGTAWAVIILKPNLFSAGPTACFSANPNPGFVEKPISFDPGCSTDSQPGGIANIVLFDWNWGDGSADTITAFPAVVQHSFPCGSLPCAYTVTLTVYDDSTPQLNASAQQTINITQPPHPPVADAGGPYIVSLCACDTLTLNGAGSFTPDQGLVQGDCDTCPPDQPTAYGWSLQGAPYTFTDSVGTNADLGSAFTSFFPAPGAYQIGLQVVDNAALSFPSGGGTDLTNAGFTTVTVYNCGPTVTATPGCGSIVLSWTDVGATSYIVLTSTNGPNSGFTDAATTPGTNATLAATLYQTEWVRVEAIGATGAISSMSCALEVIDTAADCVCITELTAEAKPTIVELQWALLDGAASYNVYRSTAPGVRLIPANRVATGVGTSLGLYTDGGLINGKTYYYVITAVENGIETCKSIEVHGMPGVIVR